MSAIKTHYSCAELAALRLPGYPGSERRFRDLVEREGWAFREVSTQGGKNGIRREYQPPAAVMKLIQARNKEAHRQAHIAQRGAQAEKALAIVAEARAEREAKARALQAKGEAFLQKLVDGMSASVKARLDARYELVKAWEAWFIRVQPMRRNQSFVAFAESYNRNELPPELPLSTAVREVFDEISPRSVQRFVLKYEKEGLAGLLDHKDGKAQKDVNVFTRQPLLEKACIGLLLEKPHAGLTHLFTLLKQGSVDTETGEVLYEAPSYDATRRFVMAWKERNAELYTAATNPDEWKNKYMVAFGDASADVERLNQRWEMDATPADWMLIDEDGKPRRYTLSVVIDIYSRRMICVLARTPQAQTHKFCLRRALLAWGVPEEVVTDNGKDYLAADFLATLEALKIAHRVTGPFSPWEKAHIERGIQTLLHSVLELLPAFVGHSVAERKAIESRASFAERLFEKDAVVEMAMPAKDLQDTVDQWLSDVYEHRVHGSLNATPFQRATAWKGTLRRIADERALDVLLAPPAGKSTYVVTKKGLRIEGAQYISQALAVGYVGKTVSVRATEDYGRVVVYHDGRFVGIAVCPERTGVSRQEIASHARKAQRQAVTEAKAAVRKATKHLPKGDALLRDYLNEKATEAGKLAVLPQPAKDHQTPALSAAAQAAQALDGRQSAAPIPPDLQRIKDKRAQEKAQAPAPPVVRKIPETPHLRFRRWLELTELLNAGGTIDDPEVVKWYGEMYPQSNEFKAMKKRHEEALKAQQETGSPAPTSLPAYQQQIEKSL
jgi:transposase InsO family protein